MPVVTYDAAPGEANRLTVSAGRPRDHALRPGARTVTAAGAACVALDAHTASCDGGKRDARPAPTRLSRPARRRRRQRSRSRRRAAWCAVALDGGDGDDMLTGGDERGHASTAGSAPTGSTAAAGDDLLTSRTAPSGVTVDARGGPHERRRHLHGHRGDRRRRRRPTACSAARGRRPPRAATATTPCGARAATSSFGRLGADRLDGGAGDDYVSGDPPQGDDYYTPIIRLRATSSAAGPATTCYRHRRRERARRRRGDDMLEGGSGADRLVGGPGATSSTAAADDGCPAARARSTLGGLAPTGCSGRPCARDRRDRGAAAGATRPGSMRKTACALAKSCVPVAILRRVDQAFPHSSAAYSLTPRRTAIA